MNTTSKKMIIDHELAKKLTLSKTTARNMITIFLFSCFVIRMNLNRSVQAFTMFNSYPQNNRISPIASGSIERGYRLVSRSSSDLIGKSENVQLEGLLPDEEFDRLAAVDKTLRALQLQLPKVLTKPLTPSMADEAYTKDNFHLSVLVDDENDGGGEDGDNYFPIKDEGDDSIVILNRREDLVALSDVLVLTTAIAQQAVLVAGSTDTKVKVECQLIVDKACKIVRVPWRARTPTFGGNPLATTENVNRINTFEGITDCYLSSIEDEIGDDKDDIGKVKRFVVRKVTFNGRILNGPAIGKALKSIQSTVTNLQQNPILQVARTRMSQDVDNNNNRGGNIFNALRDEFLVQAATAVSARISSDVNSTSDSGRPSIVPIYQVEEMNDSPLSIDGVWMGEQQLINEHETFFPPCPGTTEWAEFVDSKSCLMRFSNDIVPQLSDLSIVDSKLFAEDVAYKIAGDESIAMKGRESLANFFQSMALTRKGTGGTWTMTHCEVMDWKNRTVAVSYEATTNSLPLWKIQGRDIYTLSTTTSKDERPIIDQIQQGKMTAKGPNENKIALDGRWLVENVAKAFQSDGTASGTKLPRDFLTELLMNQPSLSLMLQKQSPRGGTKSSTSLKSKVSESTAASSYYIMSELYEQGLSLFDMSSTGSRSPPGANYFSENIELKGYLGESIVRGSTLYGQSIGSIIFGIRESIRQKRLVLEDTVPPRVELLVPTREVRLSLTFLFRIPPPGAGLISSPDSSIKPNSFGLPLKVDLTSDYRIDSDMGSIVEHRLVETRINGQLTAGDQVSRWIARLLDLDGEAAKPGSNQNENGTLKIILDTLSWFRTN